LAPANRSQGISPNSIRAYSSYRYIMLRFGRGLAVVVDGSKQTIGFAKPLVARVGRTKGVLSLIDADPTHAASGFFYVL
jgi:hypothetical protein